MPVIDTHVCFWNLTEVEYPWLKPDYGPLVRTWEPADLAAQLQVAGIAKAVLVQSANSYEDTAYLLKIADVTEWVGAVVGWTDLLLPEETDRRLQMYKQHPKFRGVRHLIHDEPNLDWVVQPAVIESLKQVARHGMVFEVSAVFPNHLKHVATLAEQAPDLRIVVDHLARPPIKQRQLSPWTDQMLAAAAFPNVYAKVSGLNTVADWQTWSGADLKPYVDFAVDAFGPDRLMFGSDWPVCTLAGSYQAVWVETNKALEGRPRQAIDAILGGTAAKVYRL
jgi:L-fuconolactonase